MRITKRSPIRRMIRELEKLWESDDGFEELTPEQLAEFLAIVAVYLDRALFRIENLQKRIERVEALEARARGPV